MNKIEVAVIGDYGAPGAMAAFLARLTQRGQHIKSMQDLLELYNKDVSPKFVEAIAQLPHGTIKRFTPITVAIVGASRRFLAQARTNQVGFNYVSASLQYSDYSEGAQFVVPYNIMKATVEGKTIRCFNSEGTYGRATPTQMYLEGCHRDMIDYAELAKLVGNDEAGYKAPQGLRNILIMQGNHQSWDYFIRTRICNRNTTETQYVTALIWEALLQTEDGQEFFGRSGADCMYGACREGKFCCEDTMRKYIWQARDKDISIPRTIIKDKWPLLNKPMNTDNRR